MHVPAHTQVLVRAARDQMQALQCKMVAVQLREDARALRAERGGPRFSVANAGRGDGQQLQEAPRLLLTLACELATEQHRGFGGNIRGNLADV